MTQIVTQEQRTALVAVLESSLYPGAAHQSIEMVLGYCEAAKLDVMLKPVHIVPMWDGKAKRMRDVVMPGIGLYRIQAARSGQYAGVSDPEFGEDVTAKVGSRELTYPKSCKVTVRRKMADGSVAEFSAVEFWLENYATAGKRDGQIDHSPNAMWARRPYAQLAKCAEAQALRKAFPEVGAQPTAEEMDGKRVDDDEFNDLQPRRTEQPTEPANYPQADFDKNLPTWVKYIVAGKKTVKEILTTISAKAKPTPEQEAALQAAVDDAKGNVVDAEIKPVTPSAEQIAQAMQQAQNTDQLYAAALHIDNLPEDQRPALNEIFDARNAELKGQ